MISIIIPVYNKVELTRQCIDSIYMNPIKTPFEIIVVNNCSTDGTKEYLDNESRVRYIHMKSNANFSGGCNCGADNARGEYLLFLNNDTIVEDGWLDTLLDGMKRHGAGIVGPKLIYPDRKVQYAGTVFDERDICNYRCWMYPEDHELVNFEREFHCLCAACILIKKSLFDKLKGFDERYINGCEDVDLCLRAKVLGEKIVYIPKSVVIHLESQSPGRADKNSYNRDLYLSIWKGRLPHGARERKPPNYIWARYQCPRCNYKSAFLPEDKERTCPGCNIVPAKMFYQIGGGTI